jgi:hypothetical protein
MGVGFASGVADRSGRELAPGKRTLTEGLEPSPPAPPLAGSEASADGP